MPTEPFPQPACRSADEFGLLAAVLANPADDLPKLVYADWLDERNDPRGRFLREWLRWRKQGGKPPKPPTGAVKAWRSLIGYDLDVALAAMDEMPNWANGIRGAMRPGLDVKTKRVKADKDIPAGASKVGGCPDLPPGTPWPAHDGSPMAFLAQWSLDELAMSPGAAGLPRTGLLSFFVDVQPMIDDDYDDPIRGRVQHTSDPDLLGRLKAPKDLPKECRLKPCRVTFAERATLPGIDTVALRHAGVRKSAAVDEYTDFILDRMELMKTLNHRHQILGHHQPIQNDPVEDKREKDWVLLTQFGPDSASGLEVGDGGEFYFFVRREHLAAAKFDQVFLELQMG